MKELCSALGIEQNISMAYHPQTDGQVERSHQETITYLRHYVSHLQDDWSDWLPEAEYQYNDKVHTATKETPFYLNYGRHPWKGEIDISSIANPSVETYLGQLEDARVKAKEAITRSIEAMKTAYDQGLKNKDWIKVNMLVWLEATNIRSD
jgi:transposase InsO family protein